MHASPHHQRALFGNMAFAAAHRFFVQRCGAEIPVHAGKIAKGVTAEAMGRIGYDGGHGGLLRDGGNFRQS